MNDRITSSKSGLGRMILLSLLACGVAAGERSYINDKEAPEGRHDLEVIEKAVKKVLEQTRRATICIDLGEGAGTGVIISKDGLILTAAHVTGGTGKELTVILPDGKRVEAESLGLVADTDCAMAKITEPGEYPFVEVDKTKSLKLGDWVYSLGHSGGFDESRGAVVRIGRIVRVADSTLQSDCTLIGGDSGGPLFDLEGKLVGIHSRVGMNLEQNMHVPMREFMRHWEGMLAGEFIGDGPYAKRPKKGEGFLGVGTEDTDDGLRVKKVGRESPAEEADIREGDIVLEINGGKIKDKEGFQDLLAEMAPGDKVKLLIKRGGKELEIELKLGER
jgi:serine protease Do